VVTLAPLPGDAASVRVLAASLEATAARLRETGLALRAVRADAVWEDSAGAAFGSLVSQCPPVLDRVIDRYAGAAAALRRFAPVLEESQRHIDGAVRDEADARRRYAALESQVIDLASAGRDESDPEVCGLRRLQREQVAIEQQALARHRAAWDRFRDEDARCSRLLRSLAADAIADPALYRGLRSATTASANTAAIAGWAGPEAAPVAAAAGAVATVGEGMLLVVYGEGSWRETFTSAGWAALGFGGSALRSGAQVGARKVNGQYVGGGPRTAGRRLLAGAGSAGRSRAQGFMRSLQPVPLHATPTALTGPARTGSLRQRAREQATALVDAKVRNGWRKASANGPLGRRMYVSGVTLEGAARTGPRLADRRKPAEQEQTPR
jgi:hypothetical protein